jgi:hypothetical protein
MYSNNNKLMQMLDLDSIQNRIDTFDKTEKDNVLSYADGAENS